MTDNKTVELVDNKVVFTKEVQPDPIVTTQTFSLTELLNRRIDLDSQKDQIEKNKVYEIDQMTAVYDKALADNAQAIADADFAIKEAVNLGAKEDKDMK